jgi:hypothetical protein
MSSAVRARPMLRSLVMGGIVLALVLWQASPALACGIVVSRSGLVEADAFTAMISYDGATEDVAVRITYGNVTEDFGWVVPVPAVPTLSAADLSGFATAARITTPPLPPRGGALPFGGVGAAPPGGVQELSRSVIGDLEFVVLRATGSGALGEWMTTNGFTFHYGQAENLQRYLDRGWLVVAARLAQGVARSRNAAAVRLTFASPTLVYPLAAAGATHPGSVRTTFYVVSPWRPRSSDLPETVVRPGASGDFAEPAARLEMRYSAPLRAEDATSLSRTVPVPGVAWLTRYDSRWDLTKIDRDLTLVRSADQSVVDFSALPGPGEEPPVGAIVGAWALVAGSFFVGWRIARRRAAGRVFLVLGILTVSLPVAAAVLVVALAFLTACC